MSGRRNTFIVQKIADYEGFEEGYGDESGKNKDVLSDQASENNDDFVTG